MVETKMMPREIGTHCTRKGCNRELSASRVRAIKAEREIVGRYPVGIMGAVICSECYQSEYNEASARFYPC